MIQLRPMCYEDLPGVLAIEEALCECPWTYTIFHDCLRVGYSCWVYVDPGLRSEARNDGVDSLDPRLRGDDKNHGDDKNCGDVSAAHHDSDTIVGYGLVSVAAAEAHILNLCIHPAYQNQGLGTGLLQHLLRDAQKLGARSVLLEVRASNERAFDLYQRFGFSVIGHRKDYYERIQGREDGLVLEFVFDSHPGSPLVPRHSWQSEGGSRG